MVRRGVHDTSTVNPSACPGSSTVWSVGMKTVKRASSGVMSEDSGAMPEAIAHTIGDESGGVDVSLRCVTHQELPRNSRVVHVEQQDACLALARAKHKKELQICGEMKARGNTCRSSYIVRVKFYFSARSSENGDSLLLRWSSTLNCRGQRHRRGRGRHRRRRER